MIELLEVPPAVEVPLAERTELDDVGQRCRRAASDHSFETRLDVAVVRIEIGAAERCSLLVAEDYVHPCGHATLHAPEMFAVDRELKDEVRLDASREFCVDDFAARV